MRTVGYCSRKRFRTLLTDAHARRIRIIALNRPVRWSTIISGSGRATACSTASITPCSSGAARRKGASRLRPRHHRHTGRDGHGKRGPNTDPVGYDAGKKDKGNQAERARRYHRTAARHRGDPGQRAGSRLRRQPHPRVIADDKFHIRIFGGNDLAHPFRPNRAMDALHLNHQFILSNGGILGFQPIQALGRAYFLNVDVDAIQRRQLPQTP